MQLPVLYEDNHLIIVNKRPSEIVQGDKTGDAPMSENIKAYLKEKYSKPGEVFLGVVHRIDRPVSGAVIFARTSKSLARLNQMLKEREIRKVYWAIVGRNAEVDTRKTGPGNKPGTSRSTPGENSVGSDWQTAVHYLKRNEKQNKSYSFPTEGPGRLRAEMKYRKIAESDRYQLIEIELITGRHHQIRAQLAALGMPIRGDLKYGFARSNPDGSISLHARLIEFIHPVRKEPVRVIAPPPQEKLWNYFSEIIAE